jgi:hypothetical protein
MRNGTRVYKIASEPGDKHRDGALATVLGSIHDPDLGYGYFVEWDDLPKQAVAITEGRCRALQ